MSKKFGTDGVRGVANKELTPELAFSIGQAAGRYLRESNPGRTSAAVIGRDTRRSGVMLEHALIGGFNSAGADCVSIGIATTPAIAYLASKPEFDLGVVISASHNPAPDNGIKILGPDGGKLSDEAEAAIEIFMDLPFEDRPTGGEVGSWSEAPELLDLYAQKMAA
ncbi:MAG: phosphoglucosamine mutase, partial [Fimbriimonadaceae bacterium]